MFESFDLITAIAAVAIMLVSVIAWRLAKKKVYGDTSRPNRPGRTFLK